MRAWVPMVMLLASAATAAAQEAPPQTLGFYRCSCAPSSVGVSATPSLFGGQPVMPWTGTVYARTDRDAATKAQNACTAASRGSLFNCLSCRCER